MAYHARPSLFFAYSLPIIISIAHAFSITAYASTALTSCKPSCGGVEIKYPFGVGHGCFAAGFEITCKRGIAYLAGTHIQLLEILPDEEIRVNSTQFIAKICSSSLEGGGNGGADHNHASVRLPEDSPYTFSTSGSNKLVVIGCDVEAQTTSDDGPPKFCSSKCSSKPETVSDATCEGHGCCQIEITTAVKALNVVLEKIQDKSGDTSLFYPVTDPCNYALIVETGRYNFSEADIRDPSRLTNTSMVLQWALKGDCDMEGGSASNMCGENSHCVPSDQDFRHVCRCLGRNGGNPYLNGSQGCHGNSMSQCTQKCGNVDIPYPFGVGKDCSLTGFEVICKNNTPYLADLNLQLIDIDVTLHQIRASSTSFMALNCTGTPASPRSSISVELPSESRFRISAESNQFVVLGCDAEGTISTDEDPSPKKCRSRCLDNHSANNTDSCNENGCYECFLPALSKSFSIGVKRLNVTGDYLNICSYAFVVEKGSYKFKQSDLLDFSKTADIVAKLSWSMEELSCQEVNMSSSSICGKNSRCIDPLPGMGYTCSCLSGYKGNPYDPEGCHDIDECAADQNETLMCLPGTHCRNNIGGYDCVCSNGKKMGEHGCDKHFNMTSTVLASAMLAAFMMASVSWCQWTHKKRKLIKLRAHYFRRNGGLLMQQHFSPAKGVTVKHTQIFSAEELRKSTDNYKASRILGHGGHGTVYLGVLSDGTKVAIKKSQIVAQDQLDLFINELVILSQINHRNIVKILGCCLETQVPLLVYEYIANGTLYENLHGEAENKAWLPWSDRVRVAIEIAEALCYLHSYATMPVFHRDVKSSNILLNENYTAKLADFGLSRLVPINKRQVDTAVQGTMGYLDPEYFNTGLLTEKSDVYSFGIVLLELLTGRKPFLQDGTGDFCCLVKYFCQSIDTGNISEGLDKRIVEEGKEEEVQLVANIARSCLNIRGEERPTMYKVKNGLSLLAR